MHDTHEDIMTLDSEIARQILSVLDGVADLVEAGEPKRDQMILLTHGTADSRMGFLRDVGHLADLIRAQLRL